MATSGQSSTQSVIFGSTNRYLTIKHFVEDDKGNRVANEYDALVVNEISGSSDTIVRESSTSSTRLLVWSEEEGDWSVSIIEVIDTISQGSSNMSKLPANTLWPYVTVYILDEDRSISDFMSEAVPVETNDIAQVVYAVNGGTYQKVSDKSTQRSGYCFLKRDFRGKRLWLDVALVGKKIQNNNIIGEYLQGYRRYRKPRTVNIKICIRNLANKNAKWHVLFVDDDFESGQ